MIFYGDTMVRVQKNNLVLPWYIPKTFNRVYYLGAFFINTMVQKQSIIKVHAQYYQGACPKTMERTRYLAQNHSFSMIYTPKTVVFRDILQIIPKTYESKCPKHFSWYIKNLVLPGYHVQKYSVTI